jgi:hypothetical protein
MSLFTISQEAQIHRDVYTSVLRAALRLVEPNYQFAEHLGVTRTYLQRLLSPYEAAVPSHQLALRIVTELPLPIDQRRALIDHILLASETRLRQHRETAEYLAGQTMNETLVELRSAHWGATYAPSASEAKQHYLIAYRIGSAVTAELASRSRPHPLTAVEVHLIMNDICSAIHRPVDAIFHALSAIAICDQQDVLVRTAEREQQDHFAVNAIYAAAVSLHNLGLDRGAWDRYAQAGSALHVHPSGKEFWYPHIVTGRLKAMSGLPRFALRDAEALWREAVHIFDVRGDSLDHVFTLMADEALARAYVRYARNTIADTHRNATKASERLLPTILAIDTVPMAGPLHRTIIYRTYARSRLLLGDIDEWKHFINKAVTTASAAGLDHQLHQLGREAGSTTADDLSGQPEAVEE